MVCLALELTGSWMVVGFSVGIEAFFVVVVLFFFFIGWRLLTLHYCSGFCHTLT